MLKIIGLKALSVEILLAINRSWKNWDYHALNVPSEGNFDRWRQCFKTWLGDVWYSPSEQLRIHFVSAFFPGRGCSILTHFVLHRCCCCCSTVKYSLIKREQEIPGEWEWLQKKTQKNPHSLCGKAHLPPAIQEIKLQFLLMHDNSQHLMKFLPILEFQSSDCIDTVFLSEISSWHSVIVAGRIFWAGFNKLLIRMNN